jgi:hypothetical protein
MLRVAGRLHDTERMLWDLLDAMMARPCGDAEDLVFLVVALVDVLVSCPS